MRFDTATATAAIVMALVAAAPLTAGAADGKAQTTTTQETKTMVSDTWITSKTKISLFSDERVKGTQVSVDTAKGVVHLRGKVDSAEAKKAAGGIAQGVEGVKSVKNDLQVVAPPARKASRRERRQPLVLGSQLCGRQVLR
jgi:osmotically-inducible protein OsmY